MRKRNNIDYRTLAALLAGWENASLSQEDEARLDDMAIILGTDAGMRQDFASAYPEMQDVLNLYISLKEVAEKSLAACVSDQDYESMAANADAFISRLALKESAAKRRSRIWRAVSISAAAVCAAVIMVTAWLIPGPEEQRTSNQPVLTAAVQDTSCGDALTEPTAAPAITEAPTVTRNKPPRKAADTMPIHDDAKAWRQFMAMSAEMAEVVNPDNVHYICSDIPDMVTPDILTDDQNITIDVYESLEDAGEMLNSILCDL